SDVENIKIIFKEEQEQRPDQTKGRNDDPCTPVSKKIPQFFFKYCYHSSRDPEIPLRVLRLFFVFIHNFYNHHNQNHQNHKSGHELPPVCEYGGLQNYRKDYQEQDECCN